MGTAERRAEIMRVLCRRRHETVSNLAEEFGVSTRTIQRDIEVLSLKLPIYSQSGRYRGGIYIMDNYVMDRMYMTEQQLIVLQKLLSYSETKSVCNLNNDEVIILKCIITDYSKPKKKENIR